MALPLTAAAPEPAGPPASWRIRRLHARALRQAERLLAIAAWPEATLLTPAARVSRWSIAQHLAHVVLIDAAVFERLDRALAAGDETAAPEARRLTPAGRLVLLTGWIPRGVGRAPDPFHPGDPTLPRLREDLRALAGRLAAYSPFLGALEQSPARYRHFVFGHLSGRQWLRFADVHHRHHLKIVRDVERALTRG